MLAHESPVRATTAEFDLFGRGKEADLRRADAFHHGSGKPSLQKLHQRIDRAGAIVADRLPSSSGNRADTNTHRVQTRPHDLRLHFAFLDLQVDYRTMPHISTPARQAVGEVAVTLQVLAPCLAPESRRNRTPKGAHGGQAGNDFACGRGRPFGFLAAVGNRDVRLPGIEALRISPTRSSFPARHGCPASPYPITPGRSSP